MANLYLEITNACNHSCRTCPHGTGNPRKSAYFIPMEHVARLVDDHIVKHGTGSVTISGGEPLMHPGFVDIIRFLSGRKMNITVLTNAHFIKQSNIAREIPQITRSITFVTAIHSLLPEKHDSITGCPGSLAHSLEGINELVNAGINVMIKCIVQDKICSDLTEILRFAYNTWGERVKINLCGMDLCGADPETAADCPVDFRYEGKYINDFLRSAEKLYQGRINRMVFVSEYPLCFIDPYYWSCVRFTNLEKEVVSVSSSRIRVSNQLRKQNSCGTHSELCRQCVMRDNCPGFWYSLYEIYGNAIVQPIGASLKESE